VSAAPAANREPWTSRAWSWRVVWPLVPLAVISAFAVSVVALVTWIIIVTVAAQFVRRWSTVTLTGSGLVLKRGRRTTTVPFDEVTGIRVMQVTPTRLVPVVDTTTGPVEVPAAQELLGSPSVLQPRAYEGRADRFAAMVAAACGFERLEAAAGDASGAGDAGDASGAGDAGGEET
jgi:hypothetical protein